MNSFRKILFAILAVFGVAVWEATALAAEACGLRRYEFHEQKMGVPVSLIFYAHDAKKAEDAAEAVWQKFDELNAILSDWDSESEMIQACRRSEESGDYVPISKELRRALEESKKYCVLTGGAFDPTVGPIVKLWRRSRYFHELPPESALAPPPAKRISMVETTLSFAMTPEIRLVQILQSPSPSGRKIGSSRPAIFARIL